MHIDHLLTDAQKIEKLEKMLKLYEEEREKNIEFLMFELTVENEQLENFSDSSHTTAEYEEKIDSLERDILKIGNLIANILSNSKEHICSTCIDHNLQKGKNQ